MDNAWDYTAPAEKKRVQGDPFHHKCDFSVVDVKVARRGGRAGYRKKLSKKKIVEQFRPKSAHPILSRIPKEEKVDSKTTISVNNSNQDEEKSIARGSRTSVRRPMSALELRRSDPRFSALTMKKTPVSVPNREMSLLGIVLSGGLKKFHMPNFHENDPRKLRLGMSSRRGVKGRERHSLSGCNLFNTDCTTDSNNVTKNSNAEDDISNGRRWNSSTASSFQEQQSQTVTDRNPFLRQKLLQRMAERKSRIQSGNNKSPKRVTVAWRDKKLVDQNGKPTKKNMIGIKKNKLEKKYRFATKKIASSTRKRKKHFKPTVPKGPRLHTAILKGNRGYSTTGFRPKRTGMLHAQEPKVSLRSRRRRTTSHLWKDTGPKKSQENPRLSIDTKDSCVDDDEYIESVHHQGCVQSVKAEAAFTKYFN